MRMFVADSLRPPGLEHLNGSVFSYADQYYDLSQDATADAKTGAAY